MHLNDAILFCFFQIHLLPPSSLDVRKVIYVDISDWSHYANPEPFNALTFVSEKSERGPLNGPLWWQKEHKYPVMCSYKLVQLRFKWFGFQTVIESYLARVRHRIFSTFFLIKRISFKSSISHT